MWLHEAFARYSEILYLTSKFGAEAELGYMQALQQQTVNKEPIIGKYDVNHIFYNIEDMYSKGALMLHTFRVNQDRFYVNVAQEDSNRSKLFQT